MYQRTRVLLWGYGAEGGAGIAGVLECGAAAPGVWIKSLTVLRGGRKVWRRRLLEKKWEVKICLSKKRNFDKGHFLCDLKVKGSGELTGGYKSKKRMVILLSKRSYMLQQFRN